jgi:hypothetical protein
MKKPRRGRCRAAGMFDGQLAAAARHLSANFLAVTASLYALDHDLGRLPLARCRTVAAGVGTRLMRVLRHRAATSHKRRRQRAESLTVNRRFVGLGVVFSVGSALRGFAEAMMRRLITGLGAFVHNLDVFVVLMPFVCRASIAAGQGD